MEQEITDFLHALTMEKGLAANTVAAYRNDLHQFLGFLRDAPRDFPTPQSWDHVRPLALQFYLLHVKERGYRETTVARKIASLRSFFNFLHTEGIVASNPCEGLASPKVGRALPKAIGIHEVDELLEQPKRRNGPEAKRDEAMLGLLAATGLRVTELVGLNLRDLSLETPHPYVRCFGKGQKERLIPIHAEVAERVEEYIHQTRPRLLRNLEQPALFLNRRGQRLTRQGLWLILKGYAKAAHMEGITPHTLRHSFATHMLQSEKINLRELQELLGHASISTTQVYTRMTNQRLHDVYDRAHPRAR